MLKPRILLAAPASGSGKTMITCGILQALHDRGLRVASFKCGPDYIDPMFHEKVIGVRAGNLDLFFSGEEKLRRLFYNNAGDADVSVVEGVMGYYDGLGANTDEASTYEVARALEAPVVLIINARGQSLSALATLEGFLRFRPDSGIRGVIFNQMSEHIFRSLRDEVEKRGVVPLGFVPRAEDMVIESRHLGLVTPDEIADLSTRLRRFAALLETTLDLDALLALARSAPALPESAPEVLPPMPKTKIAVARDEAFCFFYRDNLSLMERLGAELVFFSPIHDTALPAGTQGMLLTGGYPELYARELSENVPMREAIAAAVRAGMPCLAECGGFLYLHRALEDMDGRLWPMAGVLDADAHRTKKLSRFGYITLTANAPAALLDSGEQVRGHEFHYFESEDCGDACTAEKPAGARRWQCMHAEGHLLAGFPHLFYESDPRLIERFLHLSAGGVTMAKAIMVQGTMSNAGKSILAAGLCRVFKQDGYRVAPFKAQNMALNSFITREGLEMGRAQVVQAEAAGVEPSVLMNPILLKPTNDTGSQVIVNGEVWGQMTAREYFAVKKQLVPDVMRAYQQLSDENDIIVIEGAGSPAEINLKDDDCFVNMGMAKAAKAPVLLVGDIDRGGVFAQLWGTVGLLDPDERAMVKGLVINKFRGDESILTPGVRQLEALTGIPAVGVVPYLHLDIDDEDSLSERLTNRAAALVDIAVIRVPRLSNFTDFRALEAVEGVSVRYVDTVAGLGNPDMVILPGTKNTMKDLLWLRQTGLEGRILQLNAAGCAVFGICGGYQMLGQQLSDPCGVEEGGSVRGMGLLPVSTVFTQQKTRTRVTGRFGEVGGMFAGLTGHEFEGYEIHMGETISPAAIAELTDSVSGTSRSDGCQAGSVYGSYVHGILDGDEVAGAVIRALAEKKGVDPASLGRVSGEEHKQRQYDLLADALRAHMDMKKIYDILEAGV